MGLGIVRFCNQRVVQKLKLMFSAISWAPGNLGIKVRTFINNPRNAEFKNIIFLNPCLNICRDEAKTVNTMICTFTLCVLYIVWQLKHVKVNNVKFFIRNLLYILSKIFEKKQKIKHILKLWVSWAISGLFLGHLKPKIMLKTFVLGFFDHPLLYFFCYTKKCKNYHLIRLRVKRILAIYTTIQYELCKKSHIKLKKYICT